MANDGCWDMVDGGEVAEKVTEHSTTRNRSRHIRRRRRRCDAAFMKPAHGP